MKTNRYVKKMKSKQKELIKRRATKYVRFQDKLDKNTSKEMTELYLQSNKFCCPVCESEWRNVGKSKQVRAQNKAICQAIKEAI